MHESSLSAEIQYDIVFFMHRSTPDQRRRTFFLPFSYLPPKNLSRRTFFLGPSANHTEPVVEQYRILATITNQCIVLTYTLLCLLRRDYYGFCLFVRSLFIPSHPLPSVMCFVRDAEQIFARTVPIILYQYFRSQAVDLPLLFSLPFFYFFLSFFFSPTSFL